MPLPLFLKQKTKKQCFYFWDTQLSRIKIQSGSHTASESLHQWNLPFAWNHREHLRGKETMDKLPPKAYTECGKHLPSPMVSGIDAEFLYLLFWLLTLNLYSFQELYRQERPDDLTCFPVLFPRKHVDPGNVCNPHKVILLDCLKCSQLSFSFFRPPKSHNHPWRNQKTNGRSTT